MYITELRIFQHPQSNSCVDRAHVVLSVSAVGLDPLRYRWKKNGEDITDDDITGTNTQTLNIHSFSQIHQGYYSCTVSSSQQSIQSEAANLTLGKPSPRDCSLCILNHLHHPCSCSKTRTAASNLLQWPSSSTKW